MIAWLVITSLLSQADFHEGNFIPNSCGSSRTYASPSGSLRLLVEPLVHHAHGPARCKLIRDDQIVWERELPYTFCPAAVLDDGHVFGAASTNRFTNDVQPDHLIERSLHVVILTPDGKEGLKDSQAVEAVPFSRYVTRRPFVAAMFVHGSTATVHVKLPVSAIARAATESYWTYDVPKARRISEFNLAELAWTYSNASVCRTQRISGTPLILIHALDNASQPVSPLFVVLEGGLPIWQRELWFDYSEVSASRFGRATASRVYCEDFEKDPILSVDDSSPCFWIRSIKSNERLQFCAVRNTSERWEIRKTE